MGTVSKHVFRNKHTKMKLFSALAVSGVYSAIPERATENTLNELVKKLDSVPKSWEHGLTGKFSGEKKPSEYSYLMGSLEIPTELDLAEKVYSLEASANADIPTSFDPRDVWGDICPSLYEIRDQGSCGSCWAFGGSEAMTDRACIQSAGAMQIDLSAEDVLSCCVSCGFGCNGGYTSQTWKYFMNTGIVTGGLYDGTGCRPYSIQPCEHHTDADTRVQCDDLPMESTPVCNQACQDSYTTNSYTADKVQTNSAYKISRSVEDLQVELMTNGPIEVSFTVYEDFLAYRAGVYYHVSGASHGGHAVKMVGWGVDADTNMDYWLIANSWNSDWAENGFFRIRRGTNECGIEAGGYAGNMAGWGN